MEINTLKYQLGHLNLTIAYFYLCYNFKYLLQVHNVRSEMMPLHFHFIANDCIPLSRALPSAL